ncbi:hypothetical protein CAAN1_15S03620 [[Candida] anglica]|uniref:Uncharacterized protein n=1 Tax=[Candida] anglica TaxID=148631 RepID=A0ABP0E874_9ASCO
MGLCLSCLRPETDDDEYNERTSLLQHNQFSDENLQEELLKEQQRQAELNGIVNELSDNLIDVSTFLSSNTTANNLSFSTQSGALGNNTSLDITQDEIEGDVSTYKIDSIREEKEKILRAVDQLDGGVKDSCKVDPVGPLFLEFK